MNPERWHRIEELFRTVVDHPVAEREAYLTRVCGGDEELRREVLSLLARDTDEDFIQDPDRRRGHRLQPRTGRRSDGTTASALTASRA